MDRAGVLDNLLISSTVVGRNIQSVRRGGRIVSLNNRRVSNTFGMKALGW